MNTTENIKLIQKPLPMDEEYTKTVHKNNFNFATRGPLRYLKMAKLCPRPTSGKITPYSCRAGHKLHNKYSNMKIEQEITSEMRKM